MLAKLLAEAVADSVVLIGIRERAEEVADEVEYLLTEPLGWFLKHPNWPSGLTLEGFPFKLSVDIASNNNPSVRYTVDVTDHRRGMAGNWSRYLECAKHINMGTATDQTSQLWDLLAKHLDGIRATSRTRMMHGAGYGKSEFKRSSLYFTTRWLSYAELENKFPDYTSAIDRTLKKCGGSQPSYLDLISYDFVDGEIARIKLYWRLSPNEQTKQLYDITGQHPDLAAAGKVFGHFLASRNLRQLESSLLWQLSFDPETKFPRQKIEFSCLSWGWNQPKTFLDLLIYLSNTLSLNLWPLYTMLSIFSEYKIQLAPTDVAIGPGESHPSVTFYFSPVLEQVPGEIPLVGTTSLPGSIYKKLNAPYTSSPSDMAGSQLELIDRMLARAIDYILRARGTDGSWVDFALPQGTSDEWTTAYITATLSNDPALQNHLASSIEWLQERFRPGEGWGYNRNTSADADSTALSLLALHRMGATPPEGAREALLRFRLPSGGYSAYTDWTLDHEQGMGAAEITSTALLAQAETGLVEADLISNTVQILVSQQRDEGGWNAFWWKDDLFATYIALQALNSFVRLATLDQGRDHLPTNVVESAIKAVRDARPSVSAQATPDEAFVLGLWLSSWFAAHGNVYYPSVDRIFWQLRSQQQEDGRWLSVPIRRIARTKLLRPWARSDSGRLYLDSKCLITTTTVIEGLRVLRRAMKAP